MCKPGIKIHITKMNFQELTTTLQHEYKVTDNSSKMKRNAIIEFQSIHQAVFHNQSYTITEYSLTWKLNRSGSTTILTNKISHYASMGKIEKIYNNNNKKKHSKCIK